MTSLKIAQDKLEITFDVKKSKKLMCILHNIIASVHETYIIQDIINIFYSTEKFQDQFFFVTTKPERTHIHSDPAYYLLMSVPKINQKIII